MGTRLRERTKVTKHGVALHLVPKTEESAGATICRQSHVDFLLGLQRADRRALHAQRKHCDQCHMLKLLRENLKPAIRQKRRGFLTTGVCLFQDNAKPHTATASLSTIKELRFECIPHLPHSPDLAPTDFHVFGPLKVALSRTQFRDDNEVRLAVHEWCAPVRNNSFPAESTRLSSAGISVLN